MKILLTFWPVLIPAFYFLYVYLKDRKMNKAKRLKLMKQTFFLTLLAAALWLIIQVATMEKEGFEEYTPETINMYK